MMIIEHYKQLLRAISENINMDISSSVCCDSNIQEKINKQKKREQEILEILERLVANNGD